MTARRDCVVCALADDPRPVPMIRVACTLCAFCADVWEVRPTWRAGLAGVLRWLADRLEGRAGGRRPPDGRTRHLPRHAAGRAAPWTEEKTP